VTRECPRVDGLVFAPGSQPGTEWEHLGTRARDLADRCQLEQSEGRPGWPMACFLGRSEQLGMDLWTPPRLATTQPLLGAGRTEEDLCASP
jgi:hypothetical protein